MTISINNKTIEPEYFINEDELQRAIFENPQILFNQHEPKVFSVKREVYLPSAGRLDILLVDEYGVPIAVEVKLGKNLESRREVVAQAFDYASDLNSLTIDELDDIVNLELQKILINPENSIDNWRVCGSNLRSGNLKIVIAVDSSNYDLERIVNYLNEHSDLDVRLVEIKKYNNSSILVPKIIVGGRISKFDKYQSPRNLSGNDILDKIVELFNNQINSTSHNLIHKYRAMGSGKKYKQIKNSEWSDSVHYEIMMYTNQIGIEFHIENQKFSFLTNLIQNSGYHFESGDEIKFEPGWSKGLGRLRYFVDINTQIDNIVSKIYDFIKITEESIDIEIKNSAKVN